LLFSFTAVLPKWLEDLRKRRNVTTSSIECLVSDDRDIPIRPARPIDIEADGTVLSALGLIKQIIKRELEEANSSIEIVPFVRALLRKSGTKLPRYCGCYQLLYQCISWCEEILETIDFLSGSHTSTREMGREFIVSAQRLVKSKINELTRTSEGRPIMYITKETVIAANRNYQHTKESSITLFSTMEIEQIVADRLLKASSVKELLRKLQAER
jgi:hypothetical protein